MAQRRPSGETLLSAVAAAALAFAFAAAVYTLLMGSFEGWPYLALFAVVPAGLLALLPFAARIFVFAIGVLAFATCSAMDLGGPDSPLLVLPLLSLSLAAAAGVAEVCVRLLRRLCQNSSATA